MTRTVPRNVRAVVGRLCIALALVAVTGSLAPGVAHADTVQNPVAAPLVSFTFDDANTSALTQAAPTLQKHGLTGTSYVITNCVGMTTAPNTCRANGDLPYLSWDQITQLQNSYGWEIGSHSVNHRCLASNAAQSDGECQAATMTAAQVEAQMADSKAALAAHGFDARSFAPPYGDYNNLVISKAAKYYTSMRGFRDEGLNQWPGSDYLVRNVAVEEGLDTVASLKAKVDEAIATNTWLVFTFHDIAVTPSQDPDDYQFGTAELDQLAAYVAAKQTAGQLRAVNVSQGLVTGDTNKLPNGTFTSGIGGGWTTDAPTTITADAAGNGSFPEATNAIKLVSNPGGVPSHLFSPVVAVDPATTYAFKSFLNVQTLTSGEVAFYVDEYDVDGTWISGQYRMRENSSFVEYMNFTYTPSSSAVTKASLQVIVAGAGITAYLDNSQMIALGEEAPPPAPNDLLVNGDFDHGIGDGWTTNAPATIVADGGSNGSPANPVNSVKLQATVGNTHLFSPSVPVSFPDDYTITSYLDVQSLTGNEMAFYIDEYDTAGNWISGQYKLGYQAIGVVDVSLTYSPSTASVASASLQVIVVGDSGLAAYIDDVHWWNS
jgi:peptidoglycan/xylan/chitin deacetylase (PgdA/CDA1 family)